jgi:hypothetical protein
LVFIFLSLLSVAFVYFLYNKFEVWDNTYTLMGFAYFFFIFIIMQVLYNIGKKKNEISLKQTGLN